MSNDLETKSHGTLDNCGFMGPFTTDRVYVGQYEIPTDKFCEFAAHILGGGLFGWGHNGVPEYVSKAVKYVNEKLNNQGKEASKKKPSIDDKC